ISYIIVRCWLNPELAPKEEVKKYKFYEILLSTVKHVFPLAVVIVITRGDIYLGVAKPTEAAAFGALVSFLLAGITGNFSRNIINKSVLSTMKISSMILIIVAGSTAFSNVLAFSGASRQLLQTISDLPLSPLWILVCMLVVVFFLGMFIEEISIMMMTLPIFMPVVTSLNIEQV